MRRGIGQAPLLVKAHFQGSSVACGAMQFPSVNAVDCLVVSPFYRRSLAAEGEEDFHTVRCPNGLTSERAQKRP